MAKKSASSGSSNSALIQMQKLANQTQVTLQNMVNSSNKLQMEYNKQEAQVARDWQTNMSKTAHQMEVEDLKKAGLNPVLSSGGSGAQSYTTSSASTQNDSGASAVAGVQSAQLGALGNMESSRIQAAAQRAAAAQSAAAMRAAAATSAAAQKYAADMSYAQSKYKTDAEAKVRREQMKVDKWISQNKQASSWSAFTDKYFSKITNSSVRSGVKNLNSNLIKGINKFASNVGKYFSNTGKITANNFNLTKNGVADANALLKKYGIAQTANNRKMLIQAYVFKDQKAYQNFMSNYISTHYKHAAKAPARSVHR